MMLVMAGSVGRQRINKSVPLQRHSYHLQLLVGVYQRKPTQLHILHRLYIPHNHMINDGFIYIRVRHLNVAIPLNKSIHLLQD